MKICIFTNQVAGGWWANDIDDFLGGSEECVVMLAEALAAKSFVVSVYHTFKPDIDCEMYERKGVKYHQRETVDIEGYDILITFKDNLPWLARENSPSVKIHWSSDVEQVWDTSVLDYFVNLSSWHKRCNMFVSGCESVIVPHGIDTGSISTDAKKEKDTMLYCSSPDRGLETLLNSWQDIKRSHPRLKLRVGYGFKNLHLMSSGASEYERYLIGLMQQPDILFMGQLTRAEINREYETADYWTLPLNNPTAELFCLNAVKARRAGCVPVVNKIGALRDTVAEYIPFKTFVDGNNKIVTDKATIPVLDWDQVVDDYWIPMFEKKLNNKKSGEIV